MDKGSNKYEITIDEIDEGAFSGHMIIRGTMMIYIFCYEYDGWLKIQIVRDMFANKTASYNEEKEQISKSLEYKIWEDFIKIVKDGYVDLTMNEVHRRYNFTAVSPRPDTSIAVLLMKEVGMVINSGG